MKSVVLTYNPSPCKARQEDSDFEVSLGNIGRPCVKKPRMGDVVHCLACTRLWIRSSDLKKDVELYNEGSGR
jgi:hypothetical protein